jgi:hypothetical protein
MPKPSLESVLARAFAGLAPEHRAAVPAAPLPGDKTDVLLAALRNSATGCDQIMQRRIGMEGKDS